VATSAAQAADVRQVVVQVDAIANLTLAGIGLLGELPDA
jgi:hypothetical protein